MQVMLSPAHPTAFRRAVRSQTGKAVKMLVFPPREVITVNGRDLAAIKADLEKGAVVEVEVNGKGVPRVVKPPEDEVVQLKQSDLDAKLEAAKQEGRAEALADGDTEG